MITSGELRTLIDFYNLWEKGIRIYIKPENGGGISYKIYDFNKSKVLSEAHLYSQYSVAEPLIKVLEEAVRWVKENYKEGE